MNVPAIALGDLGFGWADHLAALSWWDCIFRRPAIFEAALKRIPPERLLRALLLLAGHGLGCFVALAAAGRAFLVWGLELPPDPPGTLFEATFGQAIASGLRFYGGTFLGMALAQGLRGRRWLGNTLLVLPLLLIFDPDQLGAVGIALGVAGGAAGLGTGAAAVGITAGITAGLATAISIGLGGGTPSGIAFGLALGLVGGLALAGSRRPAAGSLAGLAGGLAFGLSVGNAYGLAIGLDFGLSFALAYQLAFFRVFYLPAHLARVLAAGRQPSPRQRHPLLADHCIHLPLPFLDSLLVAYAESAPLEGARDIERLIDFYPSQRGAALRAKVVITVRRAAETAGLEQIGAVLEELPSGPSGFLAETAEARRLAREVTAAARRLDEAPRGYLRAPYAEILIDKIEIFRHEIAGFRAPLSTELRRAAEQWQEVARDRFAEARRLSPGNAFLPVFRAGEAIEREFDAYVPRRGLLVDLEEQIHLASTSAGVVLIGRRRTGKSTLLHNLAAQVRATAEVVVISMQSARAFSSIASLQRLLYEKLAGTLPAADLPTTGADLRTFEALLSGADALLAQQQRKLVLAIDEYENLDAKIAAGAFPEDLLVVLRDSMRSHRRIFWIFAGGRSVEELDGARWTSYFVGTRLLEMPLFEPGETRELLTEPMKASSLFKDDRMRPRFPAEFWGEGGIERLHREAGGWPHLVQLLAQNAVQLVNQAGRRELDEELFEKVCERAVAEGSVVFTELVEKECRLPGEWDYLRRFRQADELDAPEEAGLERSLRRRWLIEGAGAGRCRLRVPLMQRWLRERG